MIEELGVGTMSLAARRPQPFAMELLEAVPQHRPVRFLENVESDLYAIVRPDTQDVAVEGGVMKFAERQTVWHDREALWMSVREYVRRLKQFLVT